MKKVLNALVYVLLFFASFALFLFITFPYEVLKESLSAEISQATGFTVRIGEMAASLPLGVTAKKIVIESPDGAASMTLSSLSADVSILRLFLGRVHAGAEVKAGSGMMETGLDFGIMDLVRGIAVPRHIAFDAKAFPIDEAVKFGLSMAASSPTANPMVAPLLSAIGVSGGLNAKVDLDLDNKNPADSSGSLDLNLTKAVLKLSNPSLGLTDQEFKKAQIKAKVEKGLVVFDNSSGFISEELELTTEGKITLKAVPTASLLDLKIAFKLDKGLKEKFGFVIDAIVGNAQSDGKLTMQVRGPMEQPTVQTF